MYEEQPYLTIVVIAKTKEEVSDWKEKLRPQTYSHYEIVHSTKRGIPEAWSDAVSKASGDILVFSETDTEPIHDDWLETIAHNFEVGSHQVVHFGEFRGYGSFNFSNLAMDPALAQEYEIDNSFKVGEDSEWFARMDKNGVEFEHNPLSPVYHQPRPLDREIDRSFLYGLSNARCLYRHGRLGPGANTENATVGSESGLQDWIRLFADRGREVLLKKYASVRYWFGLFLGLIIYAPSGIVYRTKEKFLKR